MVARIYKPARTAMQSGPARTKEWVLEYEPEMAREIDPLMGWTSSRDMKQQLQLSFDTQGRGGGLRRAQRHSLSAGRAQAPPAGAQVLFRQFSLRPHRLLDALADAAPLCAPKGHHNRRPVDGHCG